VDGLQLLQKVKSDPRYKDLPVLMISSMPPEEATVRSLGLGAADFFPKPFRVRELLARVKAHLRVGRELNQARAEARSRSEMMDIMQEVTASLKPEEIYQILVRRVAQGLNISRCSIVIAGPEDETGTVVAAFENPMLHNLSVDLGKYPEIRRALATGDVVLIRDATTDPLYDAVRTGWSTESQAVQTRSAIALRFSLRAEPAGVFFLRTTTEDAPLNEQDVVFAEHVITAAVSALEKAYDLESAVMGQEQMRHLAETDPLTNCFNRRALMQKLEQEMDRAARYATMLTGMMIDIDNFKQINDTHGHLVGDRVLKQLSNLLKREQRSVDIVARYGGEEFVVLLPETTAAESRNFAERILRRVATHDFGEPGKPVRVTISVGIASYPDERVSDGESLLRLADSHLYRAKSDGRNRFRD
jgi:two-component system cell cycle response regulator